MDINKFLKSKTFIGIVAGVFFLALLAGSFHAGVLVGYRKARFSYDWGEQYDRNFGGSRRAVFGIPFGGPKFMSAHGIFGSIIKVEDQSIVIRGSDNLEKIVIINDKTTITKVRATIAGVDLKTGDNVVVIGEPNEKGEITAKFIRVLP